MKLDDKVGFQMCASSVNVECSRYRENNDNYQDRHMKLTISVVRDGQVSPLHYLVDTNIFGWRKASIRIKGLYGITA